MESSASPARSEQLQRKIGMVSGWLTDASARFWSHPKLPELLPDLFFALYSIVRASVPLMETARVEAERRSRTDPVASALASYLARHIQEELHHDEWLLDDLETLGVSRQAVSKRQPPVTAAALVGSQYYWILHCHPVAVLGFLAVLEGNPPSEEFLEGVIRKNSLPADAFRTYLKHARLDPHHRRELYEAIDGMRLTDSQMALLGTSAFQTARFAAALFEDLANSAGYAVFQRGANAVAVE